MCVTRFGGGFLQSINGGNNACGIRRLGNIRCYVGSLSDRTINIHTVPLQVLKEIAAVRVGGPHNARIATL
jgi:hypothetical protein